MRPMLYLDVLPPLRERLRGRLRGTTLNTIEIRGFVLTSVLTRPLFRLTSCVFTYEERRGRESNARIAVLPSSANSFVHRIVHRCVFLSASGNTWDTPPSTLLPMKEHSRAREQK